MTPAARWQVQGLDRRVVAPETLDGLPASDPEARRARRDLWRIHHVMGTRRLLRRTILGATAGRTPRRVLEIGCGDGRLLPAVAHRLRWTDLELTLLDRQPVIDPALREAGSRRRWRVRPVQADVFDWLRTPQEARFDLVVATLFLHHFEPAALRRLLQQLAARADALVAIEPRRSPLSLLASQLVVLLGAGAATRGDAVLSVRAGFRAQELSACWPTSPAWQVREHAGGAFSHVFAARRIAGA